MSRSGDGSETQDPLVGKILGGCLLQKRWASLGKGSPPLLVAMSSAEGEVALAVVLAIVARAILDLRFGRQSSMESAGDFDTTASSATPMA